MIKAIEDIRLSDEHTKEVIQREQAVRGDSTATKTARAMVLERAAQLEMQRATAPRKSRPKSTAAVA